MLLVGLFGAGFQGFPKMFAAEEAGEAVFEGRLHAFSVGETPRAFVFAIVRDGQHLTLLGF